MVKEVRHWHVLFRELLSTSALEMELGASWTSGKCPCLWQRCWNKMMSKGPLNPLSSRIFWWQGKKQEVKPSSLLHVSVVALCLLTFKFLLLHLVYKSWNLWFFPFVYWFYPKNQNPVLGLKLHGVLILRGGSRKAEQFQLTRNQQRYFFLKKYSVFHVIVDFGDRKGNWDIVWLISQLKELNAKKELFFSYQALKVSPGK